MQKKETKKKDDEEYMCSDAFQTERKNENKNVIRFTPRSSITHILILFCFIRQCVFLLILCHCVCVCVECILLPLSHGITSKITKTEKKNGKKFQQKKCQRKNKIIRKKMKIKNRHEKKII